MDTVILKYTDRGSGVEMLQSFDIYSINYVDFDIVKVLHPRLDGSYDLDTVGYRPMFTVDFAPLFDDKSKLFFLLGFISSNSKRLVYQTTFTTTPYIVGNVDDIVTVQESSLDFNHLENLHFANAFTITFKKLDLVSSGDSGSLKVLTPIYSGVISEGTYLCNLIDVSSAEIIKYPLEFMASSALEDLCFGYSHKITLQFSPLDAVDDIAKITWLMSFLLSKNTQINTIGLGLSNKKYDTIFRDTEVRFNFIQGVSRSLSITLTFYEKDIRTSYETLDVPFILDHDILGSKVLG